MAIPQIVIVGRPNVGKSSIFNWLAGKRLAIVDPTAGVTRDRVTFLMEEEGRFFELVDTGGIGVVDKDQLSEHIEHQIELAIDSADVILFVVDTLTQVVPLDIEVASRLRPLAKPVILVANKTDHDGLSSSANDFYRLGFDTPHMVSTTQSRGKADLLEAILERLPPETDELPVESEMKVAIVGRRNVGKSTFVNTLAQAERMIVSEVPGTTRDSVDVRFEMDGHAFLAIDTPGLTRSRAVKTDLDFYSLHRAQRSVRRADVVLMFFDATQPVGRVDKQLVQYIGEECKPCIFVVNKWDLYAEGVRTGEWEQYLRDTFPGLDYIPVAFITGQTGKNLKTLINHAQMLFRQARERIGTSPLNRLLRAALERNPPPLYKNRRPRVFYITQAGVQPPTLVVFCNNPAAFSETYRRFLSNALRDGVSFAEVPFHLHFRPRSNNDNRDEFPTAVGAGGNEEEEVVSGDGP